MLKLNPIIGFINMLAADSRIVTLVQWYYPLASKWHIPHANVILSQDDK